MTFLVKHINSVEGIKIKADRFEVETRIIRFIEKGVTIAIIGLNTLFSIIVIED